jgi:hypothetical protein
MSHLTAHRQLAHDIKITLSKYGISTFVAHDDIEPTREWQEQIELALSTADIGVALLHSGFISSKWCPMEVGWLLGRGKMVVGIKYDLDPFGFLAKNQALNAKGKSTQGISNGIIKILMNDDTISDFIREACCQRLLSADSYIDANEIAQTLDAIKPFNETQRKIIKTALEINDQVSNAYARHTVKKLI